MPNSASHQGICLAAHFGTAWTDRVYGLWRRRRGHYDAFTLACLRRAWYRQPGLRNLLGYLDCRRACGFAPSTPLLAHLARLLPQARGRDLHRALNLLLEGAAGQAPLSTLDRATLRALAGHSPPLAAALLEVGHSLEAPAITLAGLHTQQPAWRAAFIEQLTAVRGSICVVGNAASLAGAGLGARIDAHRTVLRFNRYSAAGSAAADIGTRIDVWVCSPEFTTAHLTAHCPAQWLLLSGNDMRYQLYDWTRLLPLLAGGCRVLTVPGTVWRELVRVLHAPPSAGVLSLAWLIGILAGDPAGIAVAGFQTGRQPVEASRGYHHAAPGQRAGSRHNWQGELRLLQHWQRHGLSVLEPT